MKNLKIKNFEIKINQILIEQKNRLVSDTACHLEEFNQIEFIKFSNEAPYEGNFKNKIFFTYSDHYYGNGGTWMSVGKLHHSHQNMDDRGYIKGVATDLDGYMKLRSAYYLNHNFDATSNIYFPKFRNSKHKSEYIDLCNSIVRSAKKELNEFAEGQKKVLNEKLNEMTGCSLLYYIKGI